MTFWIFSCSHKKVSFPMTRVEKGEKTTKQTCLDCGAAWLYDWTNLKRGAEIKTAPPTSR